MFKKRGGNTNIVSLFLFSIKGIHGVFKSCCSKRFYDFRSQFQSFGKFDFFFFVPISEDIIDLLAFFEFITDTKSKTGVLLCVQYKIDVFESVMASVTAFWFDANGAERKI